MSYNDIISSEHMAYRDWLVCAKVYSHRAEFEIYEIAGREEDGKLLFNRKDWTSLPDTVEELVEAQLWAHGRVKWDGCSDWHFDEQEQGMLHFCTRDQLGDLGELLKFCWDYARDNIPTFCGD